MPLNQFARGNVTAMVRDLLDKESPIVPVQGAPTSNTLVGLAGKGTVALDIINGTAYINTGTKDVPFWQVIGGRHQEQTQHFELDVVKNPSLGIVGLNRLGAFLPQNAICFRSVMIVEQGFIPANVTIGFNFVGLAATPPTTILTAVTQANTGVVASDVQINNDGTYIVTAEEDQEDRELFTSIGVANATVGRIEGFFTYVITDQE